MTAANPQPRPIWRAQAEDVTRDTDLTRDELVYCIELAQKVKATPARYATALSGRFLSLLFEKPSLRTRLTFEIAIKSLGGDSVSSIGMIGDREPLKDIARNLDRWTHCIVARTFSQRTVDELAKYSSVPVINALSDLYHPCQALADFCCLQERFGRLQGLKLAFVGDGNNVAHSLMLNASRLGVNFAIATPDGYTPNAEIVAQAQEFADQHKCSVDVTKDAADAVAGAHAIYTDVWTSMGQEEEAHERRMTFRPFQVNETLMSKARHDAVFMHCLPAHRGEETTDAVIESEKSVVFDQAEFRLHAQKALLLMLMN